MENKFSGAEQRLLIKHLQRSGGRSAWCKEIAPSIHDKIKAAIKIAVFNSGAGDRT